jgi:phytoene dehydrogenase-like protein
VFAAMLHLLLTQGGWIPRLRSHEFALALASRIKELSGDIEYNTRADQILVQDGRVAGVVTSRGDRIETRHVISNASPTLVYNQLVTPRSQVPEIAIRESNARVNGVSALVVYLGLDAPPEELGLHEYSYFVMCNLNSAQAYETFNALEGPQAQATACLNNAIPDCSPPGTSIVSITTLCRPEAWANVTPREYVKLKNRLANELISQFERATGAPLREHIEEIEVATPETFARYTGGDGGTIYGYEPEPWDSLMPRLMTFRDSVYIPGLDFCGGYAFRCHGFSSAFKSGQTIALLTLRDMIDKGEITP